MTSPEIFAIFRNFQTSGDGEVAGGTQVVFHEDPTDPGLVTGLGGRRVSGSTGRLLQSDTFLKCH